MKTQYGRIMLVSLFILFLVACGGGRNAQTERSFNDTTTGTSDSSVRYEGREQTKRSLNDTTAGDSNNSMRDEGIEQIEKALNGQRILYSWRKGGPIYGTYSFETVHYCNMDYYVLYGQSERTTILDNTERKYWQAEGRWSVIRYQGRVGIHYQPTSGRDSFIPFNFLSDGRIYVDIDGVSITHRGQADCR